MIRLLILCAFAFLSISVEAQSKMDTSITYIHDKPTSLKGIFAKLYLRISGVKKSLVKSFKENKFDATPASIPNRYFDEFHIDTTIVSGRNVYIVSPKNIKLRKYILYIHGGAYIAGFAKQHWDLIGELIRRTNCIIVAPDYPLAPLYTVVDIFPMVEQVYRSLLSKVHSDSIIFMGDSAGAGLALALAQKMKMDGVRQPDQIILISPWLDVTLTNPDIKAIENKDPFLGVEGLQLAGKAYAGKLSTNNYLVSPIYGSLDNLSKISVFIGGQDIFVADARKFKGMMEQKGISVNYFEYPKMFHVWVAATFLKEAKVAIEQITTLVSHS